MIFVSYSIKNEFSHVAFGKILVSPVASCIIMGIVMYLMKGINAFGVITIGTIVYVVCLILFKGINRDDYRMLKNIFSNKRESLHHS